MQNPFTRSRLSSAATQRGARRFARRTLLKNASAAAAAALGGAAPVIARTAFAATSGELRFLLWSDYLPAAFIDGFVKETGIRVRHVSYGANQELMHRLRATKGRGFDLVSPSTRLAGQWRDTRLLIPFDESRAPMDRIEQTFLENTADVWTWDGGLHYLPYLWGTEAVAWRTDFYDPSQAGLSYGALWAPVVKGRVMGRPHSMLLGLGLYLDATGEVPSNRMLDAYKDEDSMRRVWSKIIKYALERRDWIKLFWNDAETQINGFLKNDIIIAQTWDGPLLRLKKAGEPIDYRAPDEGAVAWVGGLSIPLDARNFDQIYAFLDYLHRPENAALLSKETAYNPVTKGARGMLDDETRKNFESAYPGGALNNLWWWPPEPTWYAKLRQGFVDAFVAGRT